MKSMKDGVAIQMYEVTEPFKKILNGCYGFT